MRRTSGDCYQRRKMRYTPQLYNPASTGKNPMSDIKMMSL
jgi:hypothetical protein